MTGQPGTCLISWCDQEPVEGTDYCGSAGSQHLDAARAGRVRELADGTCILAAPQPRWLARQADPDAEGNTMNRLDRDETGFAAGHAA